PRDAAEAAENVVNTELFDSAWARRRIDWLLITAASTASATAGDRARAAVAHTYGDLRSVLSFFRCGWNLGRHRSGGRHRGGAKYFHGCSAREFHAREYISGGTGPRPVQHGSWTRATALQINCDDFVIEHRRHRHPQPLAFDRELRPAI